MPIAAVKEVFDGRDGALDHQLVRKYTRRFQVTVTRFVADVLEATSGINTGLPAIRDYYVSPNGAVDYGARCVSIDGKQDANDPYLWWITCKYDSARTFRRRSEDPNITRGNQQGNQSENDPTQDRPDISWSTQKFQRAIWRDQALNAVAASNGERFDPPVMIDDTRFVLTISKKQLSFDPNLAYQYTDTINSNNWIFGIQAGHAKCESISAVSIVDRTIWCWKVTYVFHLRITGDDPANPWNMKVLDRGTYTVDANGKAQIIKDQKTGMPITSPVPLDGSGNPLSLTPPINYHYITIQPYGSTDFSALNLP